MSYLMENPDEEIRLQVKTDPEIVIRQATWAGFAPGMNILDVGCGAGVTTAALARLAGPEGTAVGIDSSAERITAAQDKFAQDNTRFEIHDITSPLDMGVQFDAIWVRFILEYFRDNQQQIISNLLPALKPGGILCLADSDCNSMLHHGLSERLQATIEDIMQRLEANFNFDPYAGRKLYSHLFDLGFRKLRVMMEPHHLIYGELNESDAYNWRRKIELGAEQSGCRFEAYDSDEFSHFPSRYEAFRDEFSRFFASPRRFTYTPLIIARGLKP